MTPKELQKKYPLPKPWYWAIDLNQHNYHEPGIRHKDTKNWWHYWCEENRIYTHSYETDQKEQPVDNLDEGLALIYSLCLLGEYLE